MANKYNKLEECALFVQGTQQPAGFIGEINGAMVQVVLVPNGHFIEMMRLAQLGQEKEVQDQTEKKIIATN